jgi:ornithine carbamoyltransferase
VTAPYADAIGASVGAPLEPSPTPPRHFLSVADLDRLELDRVLTRAAALRRDRHAGRRMPRLLADRQVALLFEKPSLRTRVSFDVGISLLGGHAVYLGPEEVQVGRRETAGDVGRNLSRWVDAIVHRTFAHATIAELAAAASVPVVNALDEREHPCQALADVLTLELHLGELRGRTLAYVGDGNNVCHSLILAAVQRGMRIRVATPAGHEPDAGVVERARRLARLGGGAVEIGSDPVAAVRGADAVYTDVWTSMGADGSAERSRRFAGFQVNAELMAGAPGALVMHCLPAHRGEEITSELLDGERSVVGDQAESRMYVQQALLVDLLGGEPGGQLSG